MIISNYNTTFRRIEEADLETVRFWRNSKDINQFMEYREYITPEMQKIWFSKINNLYNHYFLIEYNGETVGLVNCKNIEIDKRTLEVGVFLFKENYRRNIIFPVSSLVVCETFVDFYNIEIIETHVLKTNKEFSRMLMKLGYRLYDNQEDISNQKYFIKNPDLENTFHFLRDNLSKASPCKQKTTIIFNKNEPPDIIDFFIKAYNKMPDCMKARYAISRISPL